MYQHERSLVHQLADKPFVLIGVNSDKDLNTIRKTVKEKELTWRSFQNNREGKPDISKEWGVRGWPTIYVIDAEGKIRFKNVRGEKMDQAVEELLKEMGEEVTISHDDEEDKPAAGEGGDDDGDDDDGSDKDGDKDGGKDDEK